jgi:hypothetical protein
MPDVTVRTSVHTRGNADLRVIARELRAMNDRKVKDLFKGRLTGAARPFVPRVRAAVLAIPATGEKHTGLRARIAACAEVASWESGGRSVNVAVEMNPKRMPPRELGLPLYMEGVADKGRHNRWRHPVYGRSKDPWVTQPSHPYFYGAARPFGPAARDALGKALDDITRQLNG